ncbi:MAG: PEP-CTERM sorting domain-containing protein [Verrucomicrobiota bacterium]|nr:PEP-CTERM sorting domain-containing protein [Verrucomicrobiota bacterium]
MKLKNTLLSTRRMLSIAVMAAAAQASAAVVYNDISIIDSFGTTPLVGAPTIHTFSVPNADSFLIAKFNFGGIRNENFYQFSGSPTRTFLNRSIINSLYYAQSLSVGQIWSDFAIIDENQWANASSLTTTTFATPGTATDLRADPTYIPFYVLDNTDNQKRYGYIKLATTQSGSGAGATLTLNLEGWAYETSANTYIAMGAGAVPEPSTYVMMAVGLVMSAYGLKISRHRKKQVHCNE